MKKQDIITASMGSLLCLGCTQQQSDKQQTGKTNDRHPNIILYVVDDLGTNDAGCYGNPVIKTAGLDTLAKYGTKYTHAYCTSPSCAASRSVILSGKYNHATAQYGHSHHIHHFSAFDFVKTLPAILDSIGYRTMRVGKLHVAPRSVFKFADYHPRKSEFPGQVWKSIDEYPYYVHAAAERPPEVLAEDMRDYITGKDESPFFLYFCTWDPHHPFRREGSDTIYPKDVVVPDHLPDAPFIREELARYYMSTQRADKGLIRLIEILKASGEWENTIVIFTSDNGRPFPGAKSNLYDPGIKMPFVVMDPAQTNKGITCDALINFADITPTLLDYAGVNPEPYHFHGRSFRSTVGKEHVDGFDTTFASHTFHEVTQHYPMRMIRDRKYKFIWNLAYGQKFPMGGTWGSHFWEWLVENDKEYMGKRKVEDYLYRPQFELYDMQNDQHEVNNLACKEEYNDLVDYYKARIRKLQENTSDPWKVYWKHSAFEERFKKGN